MITDSKTPKILKEVLAKAVTASDTQLVQLVQNPMVRNVVIHEVEKLYSNDLKESRSNPEKLPGIEDDRTEMGLAIVWSLERALSDKRLSETYLRKILQILVKFLFMEGGDKAAVEQFEAEYSMRSPSFLVLSPGRPSTCAAPVVRTI